MYLEVDRSTGKILSACIESYESTQYDLVGISDGEYEYLNALSDIRCVHLSDLHHFRKVISASTQNKPEKATSSSLEKILSKPNATPKGGSKRHSKSKLTRSEFMKGFSKVR